MEYSKLKSGTDIRGVAVEGVPGEPVTLTDEWALSRDGQPLTVITENLC